MKRLEGQIAPHPPSLMVFQKICFLESRWNSVFFVTFSIMISYIFPGHFIEID